MEAPHSFGIWLKERRRQLDLTQAELAFRVGCSVMTIRKIESDERRPSRQIAELLADSLDISPDDRPTFLKVARSELRVDRLARVSPAQAAHLAPPALPGSVPTHIPPPIPALHLPTPPNPLLGRDHELASLDRLLRDPQCRLLTLIGPGGMGKTHLAIEAAARQQEIFPGGVYFVSLAPLSSAELMIPTIASVLDFTFYGPADLHTQLLGYLREKSMLLILDNFEHLLPTSPADSGAALDLLADILQGAPAVKLLVTSRERLHLQREWVFEVQGLPLPSPAQTRGLEGYSAVALFLERAHRTRADFVPTPEDLAAIAHICQLLDGLPLGIELAAAWVRLLSCQEIAQEIKRNLDFLTASARDVPERHRSLRLTFDHSWKLLSPEEQGVMRRLSVFRGGFRREAAEQVAGASLPLLSALVDKSLLRRTRSGRYDLHELVQQYTAAHLQQAAAEERAARTLHCDYFTTLLKQILPRLKSAEQNFILSELDAEVDNLRLAWDWAVRQGDVAGLQRAAFGLFLYYLCRNWMGEGAELLHQAAEVLEARIGSLAESPAELLETLGHVLAYQAWCRLWSGQLPLARELTVRNLALLRPLNTPAALSDALRVQGVILQMAGDGPGARACLEESLALKRALDDEWEVAINLTYLGRFMQMQGAHPEAYELLAEAAVILRRQEERLSTARALGFLSGSALALGRPAEAEELARESLALSWQIDDRWSIANVLSGLGVIAQAQADVDRALYFFRESLAIYRQLGDCWSIGRVLNHQGEALAVLGQGAEARLCFVDALQTANEVQAAPIILDAMLGLAALGAKEGQLEFTLELLAHLAGSPSTGHETRERAEKLRLELVGGSGLSSEQVAAIQAQARSFEVIVNEILNSV